MRENIYAFLDNFYADIVRQQNIYVPSCNGQQRYLFAVIAHMLVGRLHSFSCEESCKNKKKRGHPAFLLKRNMPKEAEYLRIYWQLL